MKKSTLVTFLVISILPGIIFINGCQKDPPVPTNPYSSVDYSTHTTPPSSVDSTSITGLHKNIFSVKCATLGCHDGHFEPDYRTVQSTYSTLIYQPVNKVTVNHHDTFTYRVIPYDTAKSFLHERLTTTTSDYMPSNGTNGGRLKEYEIQNINKWIMNGCPDVLGNLPAFPDLPPTITGFIATNSVYQRLDTNRVGGVYTNPFIVHADSVVLLFAIVADDSTPVQNLPFNQFKFSYNKDDFSSATSMNATYILGYWFVMFNTNQFTAGSTVYFRYYVNDGHHSTNTELPMDSSPIYYKTYAAFYISP